MASLLAAFLVALPLPILFLVVRIEGLQRALQHLWELRRPGHGIGPASLPQESVADA